MKEVLEQYLVAIYQIAQTGSKIKSVEIGAKLGVSRPEVFRAVKTLKACGFVEQQPYGRISLTPKGRAHAEKCERAYRLLYRYFRSTLELGHEESEADAYQILHVLSDTALERMLKANRYP